MRILFLAPRLPWPPNRGDRVRLLNFARVLSREHEVHLLSFVESLEELSAIPPRPNYFASIDTVVLSRTRQLLSMCLALCSGRSLWVQRFWSRQMQHKVDQRLRDDSFDIVYCYTTRMGTYVQERATPYRILDFVDAVFLMISRMASCTSFWPKRRLLQREARLVERTQMAMGPYFDECWIVSEANCDAIKNANQMSLHVVPQAVDSDYFSPMPPALPQAPRLLFVGYMGDETIAALTQFCQKALPEIVKDFPDTVVQVVGAFPPPSIMALAKDPHVQVLGFVPDVRETYAQAHVLIAPMPFVAGVQTKVIEALAMGIPAVVTRYANEGIGAGIGEGVLVVEDITEFASAVKEVLTEHAEWRQRAVCNGRKLVAERFRWDVAAERVRQIAREQAPVAR